MIAGTKIASLDQLLATRAKVVWPHRINLDQPSANQRNAMYKWCEGNVKGMWRMSSEFADYFQFADERDAIMFMLKFGGSRSVS